MPWISAAAARTTLRQNAGRHLQDQQAGTTPKTVDHMTITDAFIGAEDESMRMAADHAEAMLPWMEKRVPLNNATNTANYLNLAIATRYKGVDVTSRFENLLKSTPDNDPSTLALRWIAERILRRETKPPKVAKAPRWLLDVTQVAPADALDKVLIPDHVDFVDMQAFVLPLALLLETTTDKPFHVYARDGGHPERRGDVIYERVTPQQGFDAVEKTNQKLLAYHYLDQKWHAPIVFQPDIDGMPFLHDLPAAWKLVEQTVPKERFESIRSDVEAGNVTHVIAYDPAHALVAKGALENASQKYGIHLVAADFMTV
jgi:hypothetical protein